MLFIWILLLDVLLTHSGQKPKVCEICVICDSDGRTAIEEALKRGDSEIVTLLLAVSDIRRPLGGTGQTLTTWGALKLER